MGTGRPASLEHPENKQDSVSASKQEELVITTTSSIHSNVCASRMYFLEVVEQHVERRLTITSLTGFDPDVASRRQAKHLLLVETVCSRGSKAQTLGREHELFQCYTASVIRSSHGSLA